MKIGVDVDEVLFPFSDNFFLLYNNKHGTNFKKSDMLVYEFYRVLGLSKDEELKEIAEFNNSPLFRGMRPIEGAVEGIYALREKNDLYALTGRNKYTKNITEEQISTHFSNCFNGIYLSEFSIKTGFKTPKYEFCRQLGIDVMIEDIDKTAIEISNKCDIPVLVPKYPWNKNADFSGTKARHTDGWNGIMKYFKEL